MAEFISDHLAVSFVSKEIDEAEHVLWAGRPRPGIVLRPYDWFLLPFGILWVGGVIGVIIASSISDHTDAAPLIMIPIILMFGFFLFGGHLVFDAWARARTFYGLTNESIVFVYNYFPRSSRFLGLRTLNEISLTERLRGRGTISFGSAFPWYHGAFLWGVGGRHAPPVFENIDNVRAVYHAIRAAQRTLVNGKSGGL